MVARDGLQLAWASLKMGRKSLPYLSFTGSSSSI
jgi:hypothetical protein